MKHASKLVSKVPPNRVVRDTVRQNGHKTRVAGFNSEKVNKPIRHGPGEGGVGLDSGWLPTQEDCKKQSSFSAPFFVVKSCMKEGRSSC